MGNLSNLFVSRSFQSLIHIATDNTASANLIGLEDGLGNPIGVSVNTAGDLSISGSFTASLQNGYVWVGNGSGKTATVGTSSFATPIPNGTISGSSQITALGFVSSSITASSLITASFDNGTRNLTFTKGDAQTFSVNIPDVSGSTINTGSFVTTSSFNAYTSSTDSRLTNIESTTASILVETQNLELFSASALISISNLNASSASQQVSIDNLNTTTASLLVETQNLELFSASALISISNLNASSASQQISINALNAATSSYATTGSNTFIGNQTITGSLDASGSTIILRAERNVLSPVQLDLGSTAAGDISMVANDVNITVNAGDVKVFTNTADRGIQIEGPDPAIAFRDTSAPNNPFITLTNKTERLEIYDGTGTIATMNTASFNIPSASFTASLAQGFTYVGDASGKTIAVSTSSFASTINTGSFVTTSSFNAYTASTDSSISQLNASSASQQISIDALNTNSASVNTSISALNTFTSSQSTASLVTSINELNTFSASAKVSISNLNSFTQSQEGVNTLLAGEIDSLQAKTGSYATTGSNNFIGDQNITGNITAFSASFTYLQTIFESSSIIYSSGSNQFGDELSDVQTLSGSVKVQGSLTVNGTPVLTSSADVTGFVTTASFNAYTQSNDQRVTSLEANSASVNVSITNVNSATASLFTSVNNINTFTQSAEISINALNAATASYANSASVAAVDAAQQQSIDSLNAATSSYVTSAITASSLVTASFDNGTRNLTFTKGDASTFNVNIPDVSGSAGDFVTTASFNAYTQSNDQRVSSLEANSGSVNTSITNINSATSSLFTSASLGLTTASFAAGTLTFTKGNGTTFDVTIPDVSGSVGTTIFEVVYTGENITKGDPLYISGSQGANPRVFKADAADPNKMPVTFVSNETIAVANTTEAIVLGLIEGIDLTGYIAGQSIYVAEGGGWSASLPSGSNSVTQLLGVVTKGGSGGKGLVLNPGPAQLPGLDSGYIWVGGVTNQPTEITTASFASSASFNTYTASNDQKVNSLISATGSYATTGSNTFTGAQTINADLFVSGNTNVGNVNVSDAGGINLQATGSGPVTSYGIVTNPANGDLVINNNPGNGRLMTFGQTDARAQIWGGLYLNKVDGGGGVVMTTHSGSLFLTPSGQSSTTESVLHITSSSPVNNVNLIFKDNNSAGDTILSGSNNIFTNPAAPAAGRKNYIGGNSNLFLNGQSDQLPTITGSAASVSGNTATMNGNYIAGTQTFAINQARNTGLHTYNNNILAGTGAWTFNTTGNTGAVTVSNNLGLTSTLVLNSPSRSLAQINAGESGSNALTVTNNSIAGTLVYNGPVSSSLVHTIQQNIIAGTYTLNVQSQSRAITTLGNIINGTLTLNDNTVFAPTLGSNNSFQSNNINGALIVNQRASSSFNILNNNINTWTVSNDFDASSITTAGSRIFVMNGNILFGAQNNNIYLSGSNGAVGFTRGFNNNIFGGAFISASVVANGGDSNMVSTIGVGQNLNIVGTAKRDASNTAGALQTQGSAFFGRFNKEGAGFNTTAEVILAVGTGTSGSAGITRKTGFLIDSGSNTFIEGTLNVSGSSRFNGNTTITGSLILSSSAAIELDVIGNVSVTGSINVNSGSYNGQAVTNITPVSSSLLPVLNMVTLTTAEYALITPDSQTLYIIV